MAAPELPGVDVVGPLRSEKGLGEAVRALLRAIRAAGVPYAVNDFVDENAENIVRDVIVPRVGLPYPINILSVNPDGFEPFTLNVDVRRLRRGRYTIGYWFWELPVFPAEWNDRYDHMDEIWVGSSYTQDAISRAAPVPVIRIPPTLDPNPPLGQLSRADLGLPASAFVVAFMFDAHSTLGRKNPAGLVRAFRAAFPSEPDVRLVIKSARLNDAPGADREELFQAIRGDGRIVLLGGVLPRVQVTALLNLADCYASLHRSEGFGLTMAEAMILGKPVIGTRYSGNLDFMTPANSLLVDAQLATISRDYGPYRTGQTWAEPDVGQAAEMLRWVYRNREAASRMGQRARAEVVSQYRPEAVGERIAKRLSVIQSIGRPTAPIRPVAHWEMRPDTFGPSPVVPVGSMGKCLVSVIWPDQSEHKDVWVVGRWLTQTGDPLPGVGAVRMAPVPPLVGPHDLPTALVQASFVTPAAVGEYLIDLDLQTPEGVSMRPAGATPVRVPVRVVNPASGGTGS